MRETYQYEQKPTYMYEQRPTYTYMKRDLHIYTYIHKWKETYIYTHTHLLESKAVIQVLLIFVLTVLVVAKQRPTSMKETHLHICQETYT